MMRALPGRMLAWLLVVPLLAGNLALGATLSNQASGTVSGVALTPARARVNLTRVGSVATAAVAEIAPNQVRTASTANSFVYDILPTIGPGDSGVSRIDLTVPPGYGNVSVGGMSVGGVPLANGCPAPAAGQYCASLAGSVVTIVLGTKVTTSLTDIRIDFVADGPPAAGTADFTAVVADAGMSLAAVPGNADGDAADANSESVDAMATQGVVLKLQKIANKRDALVGEVVTYAIEIRNMVASDVVSVRIEDQIPPDFKYVKSSARLDGAPIPEPTGNRPLVFQVGTVPAFADANGNGTADPGEPGYRLLVYQLVIGSGAKPGAYTNTAVAKDFCAACRISNETSAKVEVRLDPVFDLGTIVGKVFEDRDRNGWQDAGEPGIADAFVALDDGTYALTDEYGRYHFPAVRPGHRMVKIDLLRLPPGATATTHESVVVYVTPGLMVTADFGVCLRRETESIGTPSTPVLAVDSEHSDPPVEVQGSAEALSLLVNGSEVPLKTSDAHLKLAELPESLRLRGNLLEPQARFELDADRRDEVREWSLVLSGPAGEAAKRFDGHDAPPATLAWDGKRDDGKMIAAGEVYAYQFEVTYRDGSRSTSPRRLVGVNRTSITALNLLGDAFETGKAVLSPKARSILDETAAAIREHPGEKILIEGHTDSVGTSEYNMDLSRRRAQAALDYLVHVRHLPPDQFVLAWYGKERPAAPNDTEEGRMLNRRVVIQGQVKNAQETHVLDQYRSSPEVRIDGQPVALSDEGRFFTPVDGKAAEIQVAMTDGSGRSVLAAVAVPSLTITAPVGERLLPYGGSDGGCTAGTPLSPEGGFPAGHPAVVCNVVGRTEPGNAVQLDGRDVTVAADGAFFAELPLGLGVHTAGLVVRNASGLARIANLTTRVADREGDGGLFVASAGVPNLTVDLPPKGVKLADPHLEIRGTADPGSEVTVNGQAVPVDAEGKFRALIELPRGTSRLVVEVKDPKGRTGNVSRDVEVAKNQLFLMAFAEGTLGQLQGKGYLEGAGLDKADKYYTDGRVAYYLKGVISGKYLITSALDTAKDSRDSLLGDLNGDEARRLLTNLDPDKFYPVYGDASTTVFDAQSRGKFYLAVDSDAIHAVVGNYPLSLNDTELAAYRRTLYGARFAYQSVAHTQYGEPDTQVILFGAQLKQAHVRDELRATGGSVYYLSRRNVVEGSEEVTLIVRDKVTGLQITTDRQRPNLDYQIKYEEGRVVFQRPVSSVVAGGSIVDQSILSGNPVYIHVDYETILDGFDKTASGGRFRRQIGDHVAVGGTYVKDELESGNYELQAADAEVRLGKNSRITLEAASSTGADSLTYLSDNGGLTYTAASTAGAQDGSAWKAAVDLDVGEWFGTPDRYRVRAYTKQLDPGFFSSGNFLEQGTEKSGIDAVLDVTQADTLHVRHDREDHTGGGPLPALATESTTSSVQWSHAKLRWGFAVEYFDNDTKGGPAAAERRLAAARLWSKLTEKLTARFERQQTVSGPDNDQTTLGLEYQALPNLALEVKGTDGSIGRSAQAGVVYTLGESCIYLSERVQEDLAGERMTTVLGAKSPLGKNSKVYTEYQWENADTGGKTISLLGIQRQWDVAPGFRFLLSGETADVKSSSGDGSRSALSGSFSYSNGRGFQALTRQEIRWERGTAEKRQYFTVNQIDYKVHPDFTLLARYRYSKTEDRDLGTLDARFDEKSVGLAYRPIHHERWNALFKYTSLLDLHPLNTAAQVRTERKMDVFSLDTSLRVNPRIEWLAKEAARVMDERVEDLPSVRTNTYLVVQRLNFTVWKPIGVAVEYRVLSQREADDMRQGWLTEAMWEFIKNFSAGVGYNFTDFSDNVFSQNDYRVQGWYFRVQARY